MRKTIQIYFKGFEDDFFKIKPDDMRRILVKGIIEYAQDVDEFADLIASSNTFNVHHYDKVKNIVTFVDGSKKKCLILPFVKDDLNYDVDLVLCFISTKPTVLNSRGYLVPVKCLVKMEQAMFNEIFREKEKTMLPVDFLYSVRKLYKNVLTREPIEVNTAENIEKYIGENGLSTTLIKNLVEKQEVDNEKNDVATLLSNINDKIDLLLEKKEVIEIAAEKNISRT